MAQPEFTQLLEWSEPRVSTPYVCKGSGSAFAQDGSQSGAPIRPLDAKVAFEAGAVQLRVERPLCRCRVVDGWNRVHCCTAVGLLENLSGKIGPTDRRFSGKMVCATGMVCRCHVTSDLQECLSDVCCRGGAADLIIDDAQFITGFRQAAAWFSRSWSRWAENTQEVRRIRCLPRAWRMVSSPASFERP